MCPPENVRCTREQKAFLSSSRAVRFNVAINTPRESSSLSGVHLETSPLFPGLPIFNAAGASSEVDLEFLGQRWTGEGGALAGCGLSSAAGCGLSGAVGCGLPTNSAVLEDLEEVERACLQRASALKEEEHFVDTLGREDNPLAP